MYDGLTNFNEPKGAANASVLRNGKSLELRTPPTLSVTDGILDTPLTYAYRALGPSIIRLIDDQDQLKDYLLFSLIRISAVHGSYLQLKYSSSMGLFLSIEKSIY